MSMIESTVDPRLAVQKSEAEDLIRFKQKMDGLKDRLVPGDSKEAKLREACQNFEAVFISKLWQQMRQSVPKEGYLHSKQEDTYQAMFDRDFAEKMSKAGGIGLADIIYDSLSQKLKEVSKTTLAGGVDVKPVHEPIPLNRGRKPMPLPDKSKGMTLEDWGGHEAVSQSGVEVPASVPTAPAVASADGKSERMTDLEVQARLDALVRRIESERIKTSLAEADSTNRNGG